MKKAAGLLLIVFISATCLACNPEEVTPDGSSDASADAGYDGGAYVDDFPVEILTKQPVADSLLEIKLGYETKALNPFDLKQVEIKVEFVPPSGKAETVRGFWYQDYSMEKDPATGKELLKQTGSPHFRVRYAPAEAGAYGFKVSVSEGGVKKAHGYDRLDVAASSSGQGYVKVSPTSPLYFSRPDGSYFFPIGFNIGWYGQNGFYDYEKWVGGLADAGGNWFRMWMSKWSNGIEWTAGKGAGDFNGLGRYAQDNAFRVDRIVELAGSKKVKLLLTFGSYYELTEGGHWNEGSWPENPYNSANGGPCASADEYFTNADAKTWYKNRLTYIAARWGYSPAVFSWEFWNEVYAPMSWVREMARYLKAEDLGRHMVATTYGGPEVDALKELDFTQAHMYGSPSMPIYNYVAQVASTAQDQVKKYKKPFILAEFGIDFSASDSQYDQKARGVNFHNGAWAALTAGAAGSAMLWWWDNYIDPSNLYGILSPISMAVNDTHFPSSATLEGFSLSGAVPTGTLAYGFGSGVKKLIWVVAKDSNWKNNYDDVSPAGVAAATIDVSGFTPGCKVKAEIFNAWTSVPLGTLDVTASAGGVATIPTPSFERDIFLKLECP